MYLTSTPPSNDITIPTSLPANSDPKQYPPDIRRMLETYQRESKEYENQTPHVRPQPLEKYEIHKVKRTENSDNMLPDASAPIPPSAREIKRAINQLPKASQAKAKKLAPTVSVMPLGNESIRAVLYDLTSKTRRLQVEDPRVLEDIIQRLNGDPDIKSKWYEGNKLGDQEPEIPPQQERRSRVRRPSKTGSRRGRQFQISDDDDDSIQPAVLAGRATASTPDTKRLYSSRNRSTFYDADDNKIGWD